MNRAWHLMGWMIAIGLSAGGCERPEADLSAPEAPEAARAGWEEVPAAPSAVELLLSEMPGRVMAQREAVRAVSGPLPLFTTVAEPKAERRADPRRPGPPAPEGARPLPRQSGAPARPAGGAAFAVRQHAPVGEVERPRELRVHFSEDVAGAVAGSVVSEVPIAVAPPIQGTWRWLDARTLSFTPSRGFGPATTYEVELFAAFRSSRG